MKKLGAIACVAGLALGLASCAAPSQLDEEPAQVAAIVVAGPGDACGTDGTPGLFCLTGLVCAQGKCIDDPDRCATGEHVAWKPHDEKIGGVLLRGAPPAVLCVNDADPAVSCDACGADERAVSACLPARPHAGHGPVRCVPKREADAGDAGASLP